MYPENLIEFIEELQLLLFKKNKKKKDTVNVARIKINNKS